MKTLFAYYSFEGNCRELSRVMAEAVGGDIEELLPAEDTMPRGTVSKYFAGGKNSIMKETVALKPLKVDPRDYDLIVVGGPVWAWGMTPAVRSFLTGNDWSGRKLALFAMHRGGAGSVAASMAELAKQKGGTVVGTASFFDLRRRRPEETKQGATEWAAEMVAKAGEQ